MIERDVWAHLVMVVLVAGLVGAPARAGDWPQFRGPSRDATAEEKNLLGSWPAAGPREVWRRPIGAGYSAVSAVGKQLFTMAAEGEREWLLCLDAATGESLWSTDVGPSQPSDLGDTGPRTTPLVDGDRVFGASSAGTLYALDSKNGAIVWQRGFEGPAPRFGYAVSPLLDGDLLIVETGGSEEQAGVVALDKATGEERWTALTGPSGYSSPIVVELAGVRQYVFFRRVGNEVVSLSTDGKLLWKHPTAALAVITTPIHFPPDRIFVASADDGFGGSMLRISREDEEFVVEELWNEPHMRNHFSTSVLVGEYLYGFDNGTFRCLDAATGEQQWAKRGLGKGSLVAAGETLFALSDGGALVMLEATPERYEELGRTTAMTGRAWTAPSLANGRLYLRDFDEIVSYDLTQPAAANEADLEEGR